MEWVIYDKPVEGAFQGKYLNVIKDSLIRHVQGGAELRW